MPFPKKHHPDAPNVPGEYDDLSREELYEMAQDLDLPGRSKMSREELAEALSEHSTESVAE